MSVETIKDVQEVLKKKDSINPALVKILSDYMEGGKEFILSETENPHAFIDFDKNMSPTVEFRSTAFIRRNMYNGGGQITYSHKEVLDNLIPLSQKNGVIKPLLTKYGGSLKLNFDNNGCVFLSFANDDHGIYFSSKEYNILSIKDVLNILGFNAGFSNYKACSVSIKMKGTLDIDGRVLRGYPTLIMYREDNEGFIGLHTGNDFTFLAYLNYSRLMELDDVIPKTLLEYLDIYIKYNITKGIIFI